MQIYFKVSLKYVWANILEYIWNAFNILGVFFPKDDKSSVELLDILFDYFGD